MFHESSVIVKTWVNLVLSGTYTREQVPNLSNLQEVVIGIVNSLTGE